MDGWVYFIYRTTIQPCVLLHHHPVNTLDNVNSRTVPQLPTQPSSIDPSCILRVPLGSWYGAPNKGFRDEETGFLHLKGIRREQMDIWGTKEMGKRLLSAPSPPFHSSHAWAYSWFESHHESEQHMFMTSNPHLTYLDTDTYQAYLVLFPTLSPLSLFLITDLTLAHSLPHFHSRHTLSVLPLSVLELLFSLYLCGLCWANSSLWVPFLFAFSTHVQWSLGWRKSWMCIGGDCSESNSLCPLFGLCRGCNALSLVFPFLILQTFPPPFNV